MIINLINFEKDFYKKYNIDYYIMLKSILYLSVKKAILLFFLHPYIIKLTFSSIIYFSKNIL